MLYLHREDAWRAVAFDASPEGHHLRFDRDGELVGVTLIAARSTLAREGTVALTLPSRVELGHDALDAALS